MARTLRQSLRRYDRAVATLDALKRADLLADIRCSAVSRGVYSDSQRAQVEEMKQNSSAALAGWPDEIRKAESELTLHKMRADKTLDELRARA